MCSHILMHCRVVKVENDRAMEKERHKHIISILFLLYVVLTLSVTLLLREPMGKEQIKTEWLLGLKCFNPNIVFGDNLVNLILFIPIGVFVFLISKNYRLLNSVLFGLFISETIECSQLIWHLGSFDVDDLFFNTVGALVGGVFVVLIRKVKYFSKSKVISNKNVR